MGNEKYRGKDLQCSKPNIHWPVMTYVRLPEKKERLQYEGNSALKGWKPKTESDETGFGRMIVER